MGEPRLLCYVRICVGHCSPLSSINSIHIAIMALIHEMSYVPISALSTIADSPADILHFCDLCL